MLRGFRLVLLTSAEVCCHLNNAAPTRIPYMESITQLKCMTGKRQLQVRSNGTYRTSWNVILGREWMKKIRNEECNWFILYQGFLFASRFISCQIKRIKSLYSKSNLKMAIKSNFKKCGMCRTHKDDTNLCQISIRKPKVKVDCGDINMLVDERILK